MQSQFTLCVLPFFFFFFFLVEGVGVLTSSNEDVIIRPLSIEKDGVVEILSSSSPGRLQEDIPRMTSRRPVQVTSKEALCDMV